MPPSSCWKSSNFSHEKTLPSRDRQTSAAPGQEAFLTPYLTTVRAGTRGNSGFKSVKKYLIPSGKCWKALQITTKNLVQAFVSTRQFIDNKWATKNPIMKRDKDFNMVRIRSFGKFAFRITDVPAFMREIFGTKGIVMTYDIVEYLSSMVTEAFSIVVAESEMSVLDLATEYRKLSGELQPETKCTSCYNGCAVQRYSH